MGKGHERRIAHGNPVLSGDGRTPIAVEHMPVLPELLGV